MENATSYVKPEPVPDASEAMHNTPPPSISHNTNDSDSEATITDVDRCTGEDDDSSDEEEGTVVDVAQSSEGGESADIEEDSESEEEYSPPTKRRRISLGPSIPLTRSRARATRCLSDHLAPPRAGRRDSLAVRRLSSHNWEP